MYITEIEKITRDWNFVTWDVIKLENPGIDRIRELFKDTYTLLDDLSKEKLVPKETSALLLEMNEFGWWLGNLPDTPLEYLYQEIFSLICKLNKYFLTRDANTEEIEKIINQKLV